LGPVLFGPSKGLDAARTNKELGAPRC